LAISFNAVFLELGIGEKPLQRGVLPLEALPSANNRSAAINLRTTCSGLRRFLAAMLIKPSCPRSRAFRLSLNMDLRNRVRPCQLIVQRSPKLRNGDGVVVEDLRGGMPRTRRRTVDFIEEQDSRADLQRSDLSTSRKCIGRVFLVSP
jgi:hypothetical protein